MWSAIGAKTWVPNRSFAKRSGEISRMSVSLRCNLPSGAVQWSRLSELMVSARTPMRSAAAIWFRIKARSGEISNAGPAPSSRNEALAPSSLLHNQQPAFAVHDVSDGVLLALAEFGICAVGSNAKQFERTPWLVGHAVFSSLTLPCISAFNRASASATR